MDDKKLNEIKTRKEEIRSLLTSEDENLNLDELRSEIEALNKEQAEIEERMSIANKINNDEIVSKKIDSKIDEVNKTMENKLDSVEYRSAFWEFVKTGVMKEEFRDVSLASANTAVIPTTIINKIVEALDSFGNVLPLVNHASYPAGFSIPTSEMTGLATWTTESTLATTGVTVGAKTTGSVVFAAYPLTKALGISFVAQLQTLSAFEAALADNVAKAMAKALEQAVVVGDGSNKPTGIFTEAAAVGTAAVTLAASLKYKDLVNIRKAVPAAYRDNAVLICNESLFWEIAGICDTAGQPVGKVNYGIDGAPTYTILGMKVVTSQFAPDYDTAAAGAIVGVVVDPALYTLNVAYQPDMRVYTEDATRNRVYQSVMLADGKLVDKAGLVAVKKASA